VTNQRTQCCYSSIPTTYLQTNSAPKLSSFPHPSYSTVNLSRGHLGLYKWWQPQGLWVAQEEFQGRICGTTVDNSSADVSSEVCVEEFFCGLLGTHVIRE
ncbi:unnamed protein product, partial [Meganyctiphanes norvegica]